MMASKFPQRKIGDRFVSAIGLGCMSLSIHSSAGVPDVQESLKVLTAAADLGINFWVTSDTYGAGHNEDILGRWFKETGRRDEIFLATKFGTKRSDGKLVLDSTPDHVKAACAASLERLQTDHIDMYLQHRVDPETPIEETVQAMVELKEEGKINQLGLSECSARTLQRAHKVHPIEGVEIEFSPLALDIESPETNFLRTARDLGVKIIPYSPLGRGFTTGAMKSREDFDVKDHRRMHPRFSDENFASNLKIVEGLASMAKEKGCRPGQLTLAWVLAQGDGEEHSVSDDYLC